MAKKEKNAKELAKKGISGFREFIARGNVVDLAVGVIIGSAFGKIVSSIVDDILMPLIGLLIGGIDFTSLKAQIPNTDVVITYGNFLQNVVDFLIIAVCVYIIICAMNKIMKKNEKEESKAPEKPADVVLLEEIRDLLKKKTK